MDQGTFHFLGFVYMVILAIVIVVYKFIPLGRGYANKQIPHELVVKRNKRKAILIWGYLLFPCLPILFSSTFWGLGLVLTFIFGVVGLSQFLWEQPRKKDWDHKEWTRLNDPETYALWAAEARAEARRDAAKRTVRGAGAFAAGYVAGKNTEL